MIASSAKEKRRSTVASQTKRLLRRVDWLPSIISRAKNVAQTLHNASPIELRQHTEHLRRFVQSEQDSHAESVLVLAAAGVIEAIRRSLGMTLFDVQIHAGLIVSMGAVAEMQTGEGKTLSVALPTYIRSLSGLGVHVATPSNYLARRDHDKLAPAFNSLGVSTGLVTDTSSVSEKQSAYQADVTYAAANTLGFDYLRDQMSCDTGDQRQLSNRIYALAQSDRYSSQKLQRGQSSAIVDEIDHVLIDDAVSPLLLSDSGGGLSSDAEIHKTAMQWAEQLSVDVDFEIVGGGQVTLSDAGFDRVYGPSAGQMIIHPNLMRPWHEYVVVALRAKYMYRRDIHFVVRDEKVQIVDISTGRVFKDRTWSDGLQQAIEAREDLPIESETIALARITRQRFFRGYRFMGGMTGTASGCESEFASVYGLAVESIPPRQRSRRIEMPNHLSIHKERKWAAIANQTRVMIQAGRAVLIGTLSIAESLEVAAELELCGIAFELLNGVQDADEAALVALAGQPGAVTVATNLAGRGTDIPLNAEVKRAGGLHVIVTQKHVLARVDRQLIGRCARCGDPGTTQTFISADDTLVANHAPWIARAIHRYCNGSSVAPPDLSKHLLRVQTRQQQTASATRTRLLKNDQEVAKLWTQTNQTPARCGQL